MKTILSISFLFLIAIENVNAQAPSWQWAASPSGTADIETHCVAIDADGNVYTTGYFYGGDVTFGAVNLGNSPDGDIFLVKYDPQGNVIWAQVIGDTGFDETRAITVDRDGNVYITGLFDGPWLMIGSTLMLNLDSTTTDMFVAKFDSSGFPLWAFSAGGMEREFAESIVTDFAGNVYVTGSFESATCTFGSLTLTNVYPGSEDIYLVKFDQSGNVLWARSGNGTNLDWATCVTTDPYGNVFIAGPYYSDTLYFDGAYIVNSFASMGYEEMFIVKYDSSGNRSWIKQVSGNNYFNEMYSLSSDAFGNLFAAGTTTSDTISFDATVLSIPNAGYYDMVLAKYDSSGNVLWATKAGGYGTDYAYGVATDVSGNAYVTGRFDSDTLHFDSSAFVTIDPDYYSDMFLVKYDGSGNVLWTKSTGGIYQPVSYGYPQQGIVTNGSGIVYTSGCFIYDSLLFDNDTLFLNGNNPNIFLSRLDDVSLCSAAFALFPDSATQHLYWALNQATGTGPLTYHWDWGDGNFDNIAYPSHTYAVGGFYPICCTITDSTGCTNTVCHTMQLQRMAYSESANTIVQVNVVASIPVNVNQQISDYEISLYPNPTSGEIMISYKGFEEGEIQIINAMGVEVFSGKLNRNQKSEVEIDLSDQPLGIYMVIVHHPSGIAVRKLIVN